ncbi:molybdopterin-binding protein [Erythrobacter sp. Alg231-14]|uniref:molybdopterin-binding protein n=1 Tax=Erythrobacter sp. Alg231-14 TaxID=1922225 RepID=UPI000D555378
MSALLTLEEAQARLLALAPQPALTRSGVAIAHGAFLAEDLLAMRTQPAADLSAMDGYAICGDGASGAKGTWTLVGESRAGLPFDGALKDGQCVRISTGAHVPPSGISVLIQENAHVDGDTISLAPDEQAPEDGRHIRKAGFDFTKGQTILGKGTRMGPAQIALALSAGHDTILHREKPYTSVLDSGSELTQFAADCQPHQIPASNGAMIAAMLQPFTGLVENLGPVPDDMDALAAALDKADGHILITSGGASVGDHDLMQAALKAWGAEIDFWKVGIKPGKPLMVATRGKGDERQVILGLPGNPVSSFVTAFLFALPLVKAAIGDPEPLPKPTYVKSAEALPAVGTRREFLRGVCDGATVKRAASQDSSALLALASSNCLIDRPAGSDAVAIGQLVPIFHLENG